MAATKQEVQEFVHKALGDIGGALTASLVVIGDKLGLYKALAGAGRLTPAELAARTGTGRALRPRVAAPARPASGYVTYDPATGRYTLPDAHAAALTDEDSPACVLGGFQGMTAAMRGDAEGHRGVPHRQGRRLARARPRPVRRHRALLPARLQLRQPGRRAGFPRSTASRRSSSAARSVADVGCGHGASTIIMAKAFPQLDLRRLRLPPGLDRRRHASARSDAGVGDRVRFEVAPAKSYPGHGLRPRRLLRLPARHGRPGRRRAPRARVAGARRHLACWSSRSPTTTSRTT